MPGEDQAAIPFFSVIIPTYNRSYLLKRAISSCLAQTIPDYEILVMDDGSQDDTRAIVETLSDPRIHYHWQTNAGAPVARNYGARVARGRYLVLLDSDDEFLPGKLEALRDAITKAGPVVDDRTVWYSQLWFHRGHRNRIRKPSRAIEPGERVGDYLFVYGGLIQTSTLAISRKFFLEVNFNEQLRNLQDLDLCMRLERAGATFRMLHAPQAIWYDDSTVGRLSYSVTREGVLAWAETHRENLSLRAYHGLLARYLVPITARRHPVSAARVLCAALRHRSISAGGAASLFIRGVFPSTYGTVRDKLVSRLGA